MRLRSKMVTQANRIVVELYPVFRTTDTCCILRFIGMKFNMADFVGLFSFPTLVSYCSFPIVHPGLQAFSLAAKSSAPHSKLPAIIDLYGTRGGLNEIRASLLASHGFVTLALAYFNFKDLPTSFTDLELEYFGVSRRRQVPRMIFSPDSGSLQEAIQMLLAHPQVLTEGVGVMGTSFGAELALLMASYFPQVGYHDTDMTEIAITSV